MKHNSNRDKTDKILSTIFTAVGVMFGLLWRVNWIVSLVGIIVFLSVGITFMLICGYRATKKKHEKMLALIPTREYSCIELVCTLTYDKLLKYGKNRVFDLIFYNKEFDPQTLVKVKELSSTDEEDTAFRESNLGTAAISLLNLVTLNGISFVLSNALYKMLTQIPDCADFIKNNEFTLYQDSWLSQIGRME